MNGVRPLHVFCGLSVTHAQARLILPPSTRLHDPIRRGDIPAIVDSEPGPGTIAVIDGVFHSQETLTLTEIRDAAGKGWSMIGCSSMGALRAVEAAPLGMAGFGLVYRWLRLYRVEDDDEVAQILHPDTFEPLSLAMVDVRWHVSRLRKQGSLSGAQAGEIVGVVKSRRYPRRTGRLLSDLVAPYAAMAPASWAVDEAPKRRDAIRLLRRLALESR